MNEVADYVAQVRTALLDLPPDVRDELLEDLPEHLAEVAAEGEGSLTERLGPPAAYAVELRAAAGTPSGRRRQTTMDIRLRDAVQRARARLQVVDAKSGPLIGYRKGSDFIRLLRPAWWVARGYLVAMTLAEMNAHDSIGLLPRFDIGDPTVTGVVVLVAFVVGSIWLGRWQDRLARLPRLALVASIVLLCLPGITNLFGVDDDAVGSQFQQVSDYYNGDLDAVYVYDKQGQPLRDVVVFDENGREIGLAWPIVATPSPEPEPTEGIAPEPTESAGPEPTDSAAPEPTASGTPEPTPSATG